MEIENSLETTSTGKERETHSISNEIVTIVVNKTFEFHLDE